MEKSMPMNKIMEFIDEEANGVHIDSFSALVSHLEAIPGVETIKLAKKKRLVRKLANLFTSHGIKAPKGLTLEVKHFVRGNHGLRTDYEIGFHDTKGVWTALAWGWYNKFVAAMTVEPPEIIPEDTAPPRLPRIFIPPGSVPVATRIQ